MEWLPDEIQRLKDSVQVKQEEMGQQSQRIIDQILEISEVNRKLYIIHFLKIFIYLFKIREGFERELKQAIWTSFPIYDGMRSASIDVLLTTIETSLIKLSLIRAGSERALYGERRREAVGVAIEWLKREEEEMEMENCLLDEELEGYERLEGDVVREWMEIRRESEECERDLRLICL